MSDLPNLTLGAFEAPDFSKLTAPDLQHKPRILMLYGSLRERSYSRLLTFEGQRLLEAFGAEVRVFHANGLPLPNDAPDTHPKVQELREASRLINMAFGKDLPATVLAVVSAITMPLALGTLALSAPSTAGAVAFAVIFGLGSGLFSIVLGTLPLAIFGRAGFGKRRAGSA